MTICVGNIKNLLLKNKTWFYEAVLGAILEHLQKAATLPMRNPASMPMLIESPISGTGFDVQRKTIPMKLEGFTTRSRNGVVFEVTESILACGGAILDHQRFSNRSLRISSETRRRRVVELLEGVKTGGVSLSQTSIDEAETLSRELPDARIAGAVVIQFVSDEPDLRIPVPGTPG